MRPKAEDTMGVGTEAAGGAMKEQVGAMMTGLAEEEEVEGGRCRAAGGMEGAGTMMQGGEGAMELVGVDRGPSRILVTMEEEAVTMTTTTRMEAGIRNGVGAAEVEGDVEEEAEEGRVVVGGAEEGLVSIKEVNLNSFFNMGGNNLTRLVSTRAETTAAEGQREPPSSHLD
ncbi:hypothetical protein FQA47_001025 [Oryzias melastigma]|uniref:Uncharacterized protein n=1 Tax=Oryzias melastigma TaxID=30732 RepID=A0A834FND7_ORYME|nr:hypothetical protein FQA47_001025 [Oryzias melastigma]